MLALGIFKVPVRRQRIFSPLGSTAIAYVALALVTAFFVSAGAGIYRSGQFLVILCAAITTYSYAAALEKQRFDRLIMRLSIINFVMLIHVIIYHLYNGYFVTWKYLYDTKLVISTTILVVFYYEDVIRQRFGSASWLVTLVGLTAIVLMSGERKAYLLLVLVFLLSRAGWMTKGALVAFAVLLASTYLAVAPSNSYIARQLKSITTVSEPISNRYYLTKQGIEDQSNEIRTFVNRNAWELFSQHPVMGVGASGYAHWARKTYGASGLAMNVHGEINRVPAESGIIGIVVALAYFFQLALRSIIHNFDGLQLTSSPQKRASLYVMLFVGCYLYAEAIDTTMYLLILLGGFIVAGLTSPSPRRHLLSREVARGEDLGAARPRRFDGARIKQPRKTIRTRALHKDPY